MSIHRRRFLRLCAVAGGGSIAGCADSFGRETALTQQAKLVHSGANSEDLFGSSVTVARDGTTALIDADGDEAPNGANAGSTYIFEL